MPSDVDDDAAGRCRSYLCRIKFARPDEPAHFIPAGISHEMPYLFH